MTTLKDCSEISGKNAREILSIFSKFKKFSMWIFDHFIELDRDEDYLRDRRDNDPDFAKNFTFLSKKHSENPFYSSKSQTKATSFVPLAIREYEAKEDEPLEDKAIEERFVIKTANKKEAPKKKFKKKKKGNNEEL